MKKNEKPNILLIVAILLAGILIVSAIYFSKNTSKSNFDIQNNEEERQEYADNVSIVDGKQIIEIKAKGGFYPVHSIGASGIPTILRIDTNGTLDCSSVITLPSMKIRKNLPLSGSTDIDIGVSKAGKFYGTCGMGMYPFDLEFK